MLYVFDLGEQMTRVERPPLGPVVRLARIVKPGYAESMARVMKNFATAKRYGNPMARILTVFPGTGMFAGSDEMNLHDQLAEFRVGGAGNRGPGRENYVCEGMCEEVIQSLVDRHGLYHAPEPRDTSVGYLRRVERDGATPLIRRAAAHDCRENRAMRAAIRAERLTREAAGEMFSNEGGRVLWEILRAKGGTVYPSVPLFAKEEGLLPLPRVEYLVCGKRFVFYPVAEAWERCDGITAPAWAPRAGLHVRGKAVASRRRRRVGEQGASDPQHAPGSGPLFDADEAAE